MNNGIVERYLATTTAGILFVHDHGAKDKQFVLSGYTDALLFAYNNTFSKPHR